MAMAVDIDYAQLVRIVSTAAFTVAPQMDVADAWALAHRLSGAEPPALDLLVAGQR
jgi:hypothetical protein